VMSSSELVERAQVDPVHPVELRIVEGRGAPAHPLEAEPLDESAYADAVVGYLRERGLEWPEDDVRAMAPIVQEKVGRLGEIPAFAGFLFHDVEPDPELLDRRILDAAAQALESVEPWTAEAIEVALKRLCDELGEKPRTVYGPIRVAVTGSKVSPGLYESLALLGRERALARLGHGAEVAA